MTLGPMTYSNAVALGTLLTGVQGNRPFRYYPQGADTPGEPVKGVLRAITHDGGGFYREDDGDIRDAFVWTSGVMEHWFPVKLFVAALMNTTVTIDASAPMLVID